MLLLLIIILFKLYYVTNNNLYFDSIYFLFGCQITYSTINVVWWKYFLKINIKTLAKVRHLILIKRNSILLRSTH